MKRWYALFALVFATACGVASQEDLALDEREQELLAQEEAQRIRTMTRNLYVGADIGRVLAAAPEELPVRVAEALESVALSDVPGRMEAVAEEIALARPHLVGLQEVSLVRIQSPGDLMTGGTEPAETVAYDFLALLQAALDARGLDYRVVASVQNTDVELPMVKPDRTFDDVRLTDFGVILARGDVEVSNSLGQNFAASVPLPGLTVRRGWTAVDATLSRGGDTTYRFVNTHLESFDPRVRQAQASELIQRLAGETRPLVVVGDFNTRAGSGAAYQMLDDAGYDDIWTLREGADRAGDTCCQDADLTNDESILDERIDLIFVKNFDPDPVLAFTTGDHFARKTDTGLWPSDHAGVVGALF